MKRLLYIFLILLSLPLAAAAQEGEDLDMKQFIFGHIADSHEWHITAIHGKEITIPLPCIVFDDGVHVFMSNKMEQNGYTLDENGKMINAATGKRPFDMSIPKNVLGLMIDSLILVLLILLCARWYKKHDVLKETPTGLAALLEPVIMMINDDVIKDAVGTKHEKFAPYLLTVFFFILINNLMGIVPFFPGGANITGNIAVTMVLALFTFLMVNLFGIKIILRFIDHNPPHFHVRYNEYEASIRIKDFGLMIGDLPPKTFGLVAEWAKMHQEELMMCWEEAKKGNLVKINPL